MDAHQHNCPLPPCSVVANTLMTPIQETGQILAVLKDMRGAFDRLASRMDTVETSVTDLAAAVRKISVKERGRVEMYENLGALFDTEYTKLIWAASLLGTGLHTQSACHFRLIGE